MIALATSKNLSWLHQRNVVNSYDDEGRRRTILRVSMSIAAAKCRPKNAASNEMGIISSSWLLFLFTP